MINNELELAILIICTIIIIVCAFRVGFLLNDDVLKELRLFSLFALKT